MMLVGGCSGWSTVPAGLPPTTPLTTRYLGTPLLVWLCTAAAGLAAQGAGGGAAVPVSDAAPQRLLLQ